MTAGPVAAARRVLIVGTHNSPHLQRWVTMIARPDTAVVVFPILHVVTPLPGPLRVVRLDECRESLPAGIWVVDPDDVRDAAEARQNERDGYVPWVHDFLQTGMMATPQRIIRCIETFRPHLAHSLEIQLAGYSMVEVARRMGPRFPPWAVTSWGSDIYLFRKLPGHPERLTQVCRRADLFMSDCSRDDPVARTFGYTGPCVPAMPASGGMDLAAVPSLAPEPPSRRRRIMVKGQHNWAGRARLALSAVALARHALEGFQICLASPSPGTDEWARRLGERLHLDIQVLPRVESHDEALRRIGEMRAVIGIAISDGISTTALEAMMLGALPIQSSTSCIEEWIDHGRTGFIVSPDDTADMAAALAAAACDDALVDGAAAANFRTISERWNAAVNAGRAWELYDGMIERR